MAKPNLLILSGFDPTAQAGLIKDAIVAQLLGANSFVLPTAFTLQNQNIFYSSSSSLSFLRLATFYLKSQKIDAVKIGMLKDLPTTKLVIQIIKQMKINNPNVKIVWDPVLSSSSGGALITPSALKLSIKQLLPLVHVWTPNFLEAQIILQQTSNDCLQIAEKLYQSCLVPVLLKGGHNPKHVGRDCLCLSNGFYFIETQKRSGKKLFNHRGTGCALSTALAIHLTQSNLVASCKKAKKFLEQHTQFKPPY